MVASRWVLSLNSYEEKMKGSSTSSSWSTKSHDSYTMALKANGKAQHLKKAASLPTKVKSAKGYGNDIPGHSPLMLKCVRWPIVWVKLEKRKKERKKEEGSLDVWDESCPLHSLFKTRHANADPGSQRQVGFLRQESHSPDSSRDDKLSQHTSLTALHLGAGLSPAL